MKLDTKCVRDVLLFIQEKSELNDDLVPEGISLEDFSESDLRNKYSEKEIVYTLKKLKEANFIVASIQYASNTLYYLEVSELTYEGHQFLTSISNSKIFEKVMDEIDELGSGVTLDIVKALATKILKDKLGL